MYVFEKGAATAVDREYNSPDLGPAAVSFNLSELRPLDELFISD